MPPVKKKSTAEPKKKKNSQPTQKAPMQRVKILGADGKTRFEWRPWDA
jgi:hypothetical protein